MTHWKTESEDTKVPHLLGSLTAQNSRRKASATFSGGQVTRMGSTSTGCEEVTSSIGDCTSSTSTSPGIQGRTNGTLHTGKENEYDFDSSEIDNEAESFVPTIRSERICPTNSTILGIRANSTVTTSESVERLSSSGIPLGASYTRNHFLKDNKAKRGRGSPGSSNELPSSSGIANDTYGRRDGFATGEVGIGKNLRAIPLGGPVAGGTGSVYGGDATYMSKYKATLVTTAFPNQVLNSWSNVNRTTSPEPDRPPGDVGLNNMGNTCFMNSGLQCLLHTPSLVEYFLKLNLDRVNVSSMSIVSEFQFFMQHAWFGLMRSIYITQFRNKLGETYPQFKDGRQHDCQEFLALMLDSLHEQLKNLATPKSPEVKAVNGSLPGCNGEGEGHASASKASSSEGSMKFVHKRISETEIGKSSKRPRLEGNANDGSGEAGPSHSETENEPDASEQCSLVVEARRAEEYWRNYVNKNNTVITNTFQGLFKSTVVCSECASSSVTYEPFMYLTVPIPRVMTQNIAVTFVSLTDRRPIKANVAILTDETVDSLKKAVAREIPGLSSDPSTLQDCVVVEIVNNNVARKLNEEIQLNYVNHRNRNIYMYQLNDNFCEKFGRCTNTSTLSGIFSNNHFIPNPPKTYSAVPPNYSEDWDKSPSPVQELPPTHVPSGVPDTTSSPVGSPGFIGPMNSTSPHYTNGNDGDVDTTDGGRTKNEPIMTDESNEEEIEGTKYTCVICLGDFAQSDVQSGLVLKHKQCNTIICNPCIQRAVTYFHKDELKQEEPLKEGIEKFLKCPTCNEKVRDEAFVNFATDESTSELNLVAVLLRLPLDYNNNTSKSSGRLFGAPYVVRIPTSVPADELYTFISELNPFPELDSNLVKVAADGNRCSSCFEDCDGCVVEKEGVVSIPPGSALAISYTQISREQIALVEPSDMATTLQSPSHSFSMPGPTDPIVDIHDCLRAFSEVEHLDEQNPWHCPRCKKNQRATKTMTICRFPDCLIIQLKRFVFIEHMSLKVSTKLRFPLSDLDMNPYIAPEGASKSNNVYDLYSCVCHFGTTTSGHYTAYSKNPVTNCWSYFNDERVTAESSPGEGDYSTAYVLFFQRKGLSYQIPKRTEDTIIRNPPASISAHPAGPAGPLVLYNNAGVTAAASSLNGSGPSATATFSETQADSEDWDSPSLILPTSSYATTLEPTVMEEMNFSAGHVTLHNFPHVSSSKGSEPSQTSREEGGFMEDAGFEDDNFLDPLRENPATEGYQEEASSQSGYDAEDDVSTSSRNSQSQWGNMD